MSSSEKPPMAVAGLNAVLADVEDRCIIQRAPVPADFPRTPLPVEGLGELVDSLADHPSIVALSEELLEAGLMWRCKGCGGAACTPTGVCFCGVSRDDTSSHESA